MPLSTNATDGCVVLLAGMGRGANANGGTYSAAYVASSAFLSLGLDLVLPIAGGITGAQLGRSFPPTCCSPDIPPSFATAASYAQQ